MSTLTIDSENAIVAHAAVPVNLESRRVSPVPSRLQTPAGPKPLGDFFALWEDLSIVVAEPKKVLFHLVEHL